MLNVFSQIYFSQFLGFRQRAIGQENLTKVSHKYIPAKFIYLFHKAIDIWTQYERFKKIDLISMYLQL